MRVLLFCGALAASLSGADTAAALAPTEINGLFPSACASGLHPDHKGACLPDVVQIDRYCPAGTVYAPMTQGWTCQSFSLESR